MYIYEFAIATQKRGNCINARNPYDWEDVGCITSPVKLDDLAAASAAAGIPAAAVCVACRYEEG